MAGDASRENGRKYGGRKKGAASIAAEMFRNELAKKIEAESQEWLDAIKDTALGHYVMQKTKDGDVRVYKKSPDPQAWEKALDRAFGKPKQDLDITSNGETFGDVDNEKMVSVLNAYLELKKNESEPSNQTNPS